MSKSRSRPGSATLVSNPTLATHLWRPLSQVTEAAPLSGHISAKLNDAYKGVSFDLYKKGKGPG
jgi:hypothetical protein